MTATNWHLIVEFVGLDVEDERVLDALSPRPSFVVLLSSSDGVTTADATVGAESVDEALDVLLEAVEAAAPTSLPLRMVDPLVSIPDIAEEVGVTRQGVRNWALGARHAGFPRPLAVVGDGIRVWRLAEVEAWLAETLGLGPNRSYPTATFVAAVNDEFQESLEDLLTGEDQEGEGLASRPWREVSRKTSEHAVEQVSPPLAPSRSTEAVESGAARK